jgi:organic radical activating enzyme
VHPVLAPIHDFARKLRQESFLPHVRAYVAWRRAVRDARARGEAIPPPPPHAPLSINLDLTTACNFACDHCVDWDILNSRISYDDARLRASLEAMTERGLRSVILIGGGEPTVYPRFVDTVRFLKGLGLQVAVVSNGSRNERIHEVVDVLDAQDWVRLSLDAGTDATFQAMHKPKKAVTLEEICGWIPRIRERNPAPRVGFSFVVTWRGAERERGATVVENLHEIVPAARLARDSLFDYVSFKPFLVRTPEGAEVIDPEASRRRHAEVVKAIRANLDEAKSLATDTFAVLESTNLKLLEAGAWKAWTAQPQVCHMQALRQVLSPLGLWNCPAHRGVEAGRIADRDVWADDPDAAGRALGERLDAFDASAACREVTCLYHDANWWLERAVEDPDVLDDAAVEPDEDFFL